MGTALLTGRDARSIEKVTVIVGQPGDRSYPDLLRQLDRRIERIAGGEVTVEVRFIETARR